MNAINPSNPVELIDRKSYILGMMTAFAECVTNECKKIALSPPFYPEDYDTVVAEDSFARVLLKPEDWPIQKETR